VEAEVASLEPDAASFGVSHGGVTPDHVGLARGLEDAARRDDVPANRLRRLARNPSHGAVEATCPPEPSSAREPPLGWMEMQGTRGAYLMNLGPTGYLEAWELQRSLAAAVSQGAVPDTVVLLEHPPTITLGRRTDPGELHVPDGVEVEVVET